MCIVKQVRQNHVPVMPQARNSVPVAGINQLSPVGELNTGNLARRESVLLSFDIAAHLLGGGME